MEREITIDTKALKIKYFFIFIVLSVLAYFIVDYLEKTNENKILQNTTLMYDRAYNTVYVQYKELADVIASGLLRLGDVEEKFANLEALDPQQQANLRKNLYEITVKRYEHLKLKHIKSVNFIDKHNRIFLKVRDPKKFGKEVSDYRQTVYYVHKEHKSIDSFETGLFGSGFRFVYPITQNGEYLGNIDITFGAEAIVSSLMKQYYVLSNFLIQDKYFPKSLKENQNSELLLSHYDGYYFDKNVLEQITQYARQDIEELKLSSQTLHNITQNANLRYCISCFDDQTNTILTTIPIIHKITNEKQAFLMVRSKGDLLQESNRFHNVILFLLIASLALLVALFYFQKAKRINDKIALIQSYKKEKQFLEQAKMAQMGEMLGNIAHQWRQPLSVISTSASGIKLKKDFGQLDDTLLDEMLEKIMESTNYLSNTIDTFRNFILEERVFKETVLQKQIDEALQIVSASMNNYNIKIYKEYENTQPIILKLISVEFSQMMMNLLNNAREALVENRQSDRWIKIKVVENEDEVSLVIEDNAGGIPKEFLEKIFDPYFTTKHQSQGTGLGLYMVKEIVQKHHKGNIKVHNTQEGALFTITFPKKA